jgi:hypothetical protein
MSSSATSLVVVGVSAVMSDIVGTRAGAGPDRGVPWGMAEFTFFVDADLYATNGGELAAVEADLHEAGVESVDIPTGYGLDLGERIPVRVRGTAGGLRWYAKLLGVRDPMQLEELDRVTRQVT